MFLTADELRQLTDKPRPSAQARVLDFMGIPYRRRPNGTLAVLRIHVEGLPAAKMPAEPRLRLEA